MTLPKSKLFADWTVVVADDEQFIRAIVVRMLRDMGCVNILTATSGHEALEHLPTAPTGRTLVLADFSMPGVDGLALAKLIRSGKAGCPNDTPIMMLTGHADSELVSVALALDVDCFLIKPISSDQLAARFARLCSNIGGCGEPREYHHVDVESVSNRMIRNAPVGIPRPQVQKRILRYRLAELTPGQVLAQDITTPGGDCLLGTGVTLTERYLRRLGELAAVLNLEYVAVYAPPKVESKA